MFNNYREVTTLVLQYKMQKIIIESIENTLHNKAGYKNIKLRREVLESEKSSTGNSRTTSIIADSEFVKPGRVAFVTMSDAKIAELKIVVGGDFNALCAPALGEQTIQVIETTTPDEWEEDIRLSMNEKTNPTTGEVLTSSGATIHHTTVMCAVKFWNEDGGDITLPMDK